MSIDTIAVHFRSIVCDCISEKWTSLIPNTGTHDS